jgi:hypothetical protein
VKQAAAGERKVSFGKRCQALALARPRPLDHAAFRRNRLNAENVIDSKKLERDLCEKPASTFSHRALKGFRRRRLVLARQIAQGGVIEAPAIGVLDPDFAARGLFVLFDFERAFWAVADDRVLDAAQVLGFDEEIHFGVLSLQEPAQQTSAPRRVSRKTENKWRERLSFLRALLARA